MSEAEPRDGKSAPPNPPSSAANAEPSDAERDPKHSRTTSDADVAERERSDVERSEGAEGQVVDAEDVLASTVELLSLSLTARQGPLPDPSEMEGYKRVQADLPERIVRQWEGETQHRHRLENRIVDANITNRQRGQLIGAGLATLVVVVGFLLLLLDKDLAGFVTLVSALAVLVGRFVVHELRGRGSATPPSADAPEGRTPGLPGQVDQGADSGDNGEPAPAPDRQ